MIRTRNKKGQVILWVIIAVVLVAAIMLFFFIERMPKAEKKVEFNPQTYIESCAENAVDEAVDKMLPQGGFLEPKVYKVYNDTNISYLCLNEGNFRPCVNLHPMLISEISDEIKSYITPKIEECFESIKKEAESKAVTLTVAPEMNLTVSLAPERVFVSIPRKMAIASGNERRTIEKIEAEIINPVYNLASIAIEIANQEAKYCYFENVGYMAINQKVDIRRWVMSDSTKIYIIKDKNSGITFNTAIRGCAIPAGL